ncbi:DUF2268 domain-containing putative Zn-dependent protease [Pedobacter antarcticus]|uniref:DUF2268 domain-containing putative Zn-dependent protease n=1 Tax=Pedobacter antarcticus TaxID=34086 RepID=UPI00292F24D2|nr:DUF2268 domain-containing putative Zn-dependent protease [Pedobacter antarcticus]
MNSNNLRKFELPMLTSTRTTIKIAKSLVAVILFNFCISKVAYSQKKSQSLVTYDIDNFWNAYDKIVSTKDSFKQHAYLDDLYIKKGSPGLKAIMLARDYTAKSYIDAINSYPLFWNSVRPNTLKSREFAKEIESDILKIKKVYPSLKPAKIYFTIGALKTGGTTLDGMVLIGSEIAMADSNTVTTEFPTKFEHLKAHFKSNPLAGLRDLNVHEYIHTQQKTTIGNNLMTQCVIEGVAEFVAVTVTGRPSTSPALKYGRAHNESVKQVFSRQMFNESTGFWLYSNTANNFGVRDLGYYIGYAICESYYEKSTDKRKAIKEMIELNYNDEDSISHFIDQSRYFSKSIATLKGEYNKNIPVVSGIKQFKNNAVNVDPSLVNITIEFSQEMSKNTRGFDIGPLGESHILYVKNFLGFSEDGKSATIAVELVPDRYYQIIISSRFKNKNAVPLMPYLMEFKTAKKD